MSPAIAEIRAGHQDVTYLLSVLSRQIGAFRAGRTPDLELMSDILSRLNAYAADGRHGKERSTIERIAKRNFAAAPNAVTLTTEHAEIHKLGRRLLSVLNDITQGLLLPRSALVEPGRRYVRMFRGHLHRERTYLRRYGGGFSDPAWSPDSTDRVPRGAAEGLGALRDRIFSARRNTRLVTRDERVCDACDIGAG
ncbi:hypothetical protein H0Z60_06075 [Ectothiorhodospiraceae bacterium WFHF3C12]|nr:hypothetical protein [Ectothiorhodospiraceae bacterium WFHF3C12]